MTTGFNTEAERAIWIREQIRQAHREAEFEEALELTFIDEDVTIRLLNEDGVRVPASQLYYRWEKSFIIGELTYCHALVQRVKQSKKGEEVEEYDTIIPVLVWTVHDGDVVQRHLKPYQMARRLEVEERPIIVELKTHYAGTLETLMSLEAARLFIKGCPAPEWPEAYRAVRESLEAYVSFPWDERLYDVVACWVLGTYFAELFSTYPFLYAYGSQGCGKSRLIITATLLSRHGFIVTDPSDASLYRTAEAFRPTMAIDESLLGKGAWKLIRTAFKKGMKVPRVEKTSREEFILSLFETYMPVAFASTERPSELGGSEADESRAIFIFMQRAPDPAGRDPDPWDFKELRDQLYILRLLKADEVAEKLRELEGEDLGLYGHDREVWLPIFTIASLIGSEVYEAVKGYAEELGAIKREFYYHEEKTVIGAMWRMMAETETLDGERIIEFRPSDLIPYVKAELEDRGEYQESRFERFWTPRRVGRILTKMAIFKRRLSGGIHYSISEEELKRLSQRYEYDASSVVSVVSAINLERGYTEEKLHQTSEEAEPGDQCSSEDDIPLSNLTTQTTLTTPIEETETKEWKPPPLREALDRLRETLLDFQRKGIHKVPQPKLAEALGYPADYIEKLCKVAEWSGMIIIWFTGEVSLK